MGIFDIFADDENPADFGDYARNVVFPVDALRNIGQGALSRLTGGGSSDASSSSSAALPYDPNDPDQVAYDAWYKKWKATSGNQTPQERAWADSMLTEKDRADRDRLLQQAADEASAKLATAQAQQKSAEAQYQKIQADLAQSNSPEAKALIQAQLANAQATLERTRIDLEKARRESDPDYIEKQLERQLRLYRGQKEVDAGFEREKDDRQYGRDLLRDQMSLGVQVRGQELQRLKAQDDFVMNMLQNQIAAGRLTLDKAAKQFEAYVTKARLPSEIMANVSRAVEPLLPYMTSDKDGDIPLGFEKGGSRDMLGRLGGNTAASYDPSKYAVKTTQVNPFDLAKKAGADFSSGMSSIPDPSTIGAGVNIPSVPTGGSSATNQIGSLGGYIGDIAGQQKSLGMTAPVPGIAAKAAPMPPGVGVSEDERNALMKGLGGK
jgi:hypothetical protein